MRNVKLIIASLMFVAFMGACNQATKKSTSSTESTTIKSEVFYLPLEKVLANADSLSGKTVNVVGVVDHVCKHGNKRFKILSSDGSQEMKIELGESFDMPNPEIAGKTAKVIGTLTPFKMDEEMLRAFINKEREEHKDEGENPQLKKMEDILTQVESGKIPYFVTYTVTADKYELE